MATRDFLRSLLRDQVNWTPHDRRTYLTGRLVEHNAHEQGLMTEIAALQGQAGGPTGIASRVGMTSGGGATRSRVRNRARSRKTTASKSAA